VRALLNGYNFLVKISVLLIMSTSDGVKSEPQKENKLLKNVLHQSNDAQTKNVLWLVLVTINL